MTERRSGTRLAKSKAAVMRSRAATIPQLMKRCGVTYDVARDIRDGKSLPEAVESAAWAMFCATAKSELDLQLALLSSKPRLFSKAMAMLRQLARLVEAYYPLLHVPEIEERWVFPPCSALSSMSRSLGQSFVMLKQLHDEQPEIRDALFSDTPVLIKLFGSREERGLADRVKADMEVSIKAFIDSERDRQARIDAQRARERQERRERNKAEWRKRQEERDRMRKEERKKMKEKKGKRDDR